MASYLILGAGKFGRLALSRLAAQDDEATFVVVDCAPQALAAARAAAAARVQWVEAEAIAFLIENLKGAAPWDWLIPMVPSHVAFSWLRQGPLAKSGGEIIEVPEAVGQGVPLARRGEQGELYLSRATHLCPDDCPEAEPVCPVSGESRKIPLYEELASVDVPVLISQFKGSIAGMVREKSQDLLNRLTAGGDDYSGKLDIRGTGVETTEDSITLWVWAMPLAP